MERSKYTFFHKVVCKFGIHARSGSSQRIQTVQYVQLSCVLGSICCRYRVQFYKKDKKSCAGITSICVFLPLLAMIFPLTGSFSGCGCQVKTGTRPQSPGTLPCEKEGLQLSSCNVYKKCTGSKDVGPILSLLYRGLNIGIFWHPFFPYLCQVSPASRGSTPGLCGTIRAWRES